MTIANGLASVQSNKQPLQSQFDRETLISVLWKGWIICLARLIKRQVYLLTDEVERMPVWTVSSPSDGGETPTSWNLWHNTGTRFNQCPSATSLPPQSAGFFFFQFWFFHHYLGIATRDTNAIFCFGLRNGRCIFCNAAIIFRSKGPAFFLSHWIFLLLRKVKLSLFFPFLLLVCGLECHK